MKPTANLIAWLSAALCSAAPVLLAQDAPKPKPPADPPATKSEADARSVGELIEALGAERPAERRDAERALRDRGEAAREPLEEAADGHDDPEVRWRARRILRALSGEAPRLERAAPDVAPPADEARPRVRAFEDLERHMEELRAQIDEMQRAWPRDGLTPFGGLQPGSIARGTQIQISPDGVRVEIEEPKEGGGTERKVYEAPGMDSFRKEHPEVAKKVFGEGGFFRWHGNDLPFDVQTPQLDLFRGGRAVPWTITPGPVAPAEPVAPPAPGEKLGVFVGILEPAVRKFLGIEGETGILVDSVEDGSLAQALGIEPRDVVVAIGDSAIRGPADVRAALRSIEKGSLVKVTVNRLGKTVTLEATKAAGADEPKKLEKRAR
ncbi:MAG: PDZ domain-containing protein [Planctomycetes bacterium]|nr:PDZ domain-containing protein [Planctomycetota bacterium]